MKILYLGGSHDALLNLQERLGSDVEVVPLNSSLKALALMGRGDYAGVFVDADHFSEASDVGRLLQNDRILQGMPDGVVLLDADNTIVWGNGRLSEWTKQSGIVGQNFYQVLGSPEIMGPDYCPFHTALSTRTSSASVLRCNDNKYYRLHAAPLLDSSEAPTHLVVTVHDVTAEMLQHQKLEAIHQAGNELGDLAPDDVSDLDYNERVALLKENILHCMKDVLHLDVIEIRMLDQASGELRPLMAVGMAPEAAARHLESSEEGNGVTGYVASTGKSYICGNAVEDPLYLEGCKGGRSSLTVPLLLQEQVIGTLNVESPDTDAFTDSDQQFLEIFARNVAMALNTLELLAAEKAAVAAASVEAIHAAVAQRVGTGHANDHRQASQVNASVLATFDVPGHDGIFAREGRFGIGKARARINLAGASLQINARHIIRSPDDCAPEETHNGERQQQKTKHATTLPARMTSGYQQASFYCRRKGPQEPRDCAKPATTNCNR